jgi:hypothetical protein
MGPAKGILAEAFHARPADTEEMIQRGLEEEGLMHVVGLWPKSSKWENGKCKDGVLDLIHFL